MRVAELEGLQFQISASSDDASKRLNSLAGSLERLKTAVSGIGTSKLKNIAGAIGEVNNASSKGNGDNLARVADAVSKLGSASISSTVGKNLASIVGAVNSISEDSIGRLERMASSLSWISSIRRMPRLNLTQQQTPANQRDLENTRTPSDSTSAKSVRDVGHEMDDVSNRSAPTFMYTLRELVTSLRGLATGSDFASRGLRGLMKYTVGLPITLGSGFARRIGEATSSLGHLFSSIKRIAMYRLIRAVIREITQGLREGIQHIYAYSNALGGEFAAAMDSLATSSLYLKNSLGAMAAPIIQSLIPAINWAIDRIVALMNVINMFVAALGGKAVTTVAKRVQTVFNAAGSAAGGAGGAAKKALKDLKTYTIGIDELNIIDPKDNSGSGSGGGGGGGGGGAIDPASMFEEVDIDSGISNFAKRLREAFQSGKWKQVGQILGGAFNDLVDKIKWGEVGHKIGSGLNAIISTSYWAIKTADFVELGGSFAEFFDKAIGEISWTELGGLLVLRLTKAIDFLIGFLLNFPTDTFAMAVTSFFVGAFNEATAWLDSHDWDAVSRKLTDKICEVIEKIDWMRILASLGQFGSKLQISTYEAIWGAITPKPGTAADRAFNLVSPFRWLASAFSGNPEGRLPGYKQKKSDAGKIANSFLDANAAPIGSFTVNVKNTATKWWSDVTTWWNGVVGDVQDFTTNVKNEAQLWWNNVKQWWREKITQPVESFRTNVKNEAQTWWNNVKTWWNKTAGELNLKLSLTNNIQELWNRVKTWWGNTAGTLSTKLQIKMPRIDVKWVDKNLFGTDYKIKVPEIRAVWNAQGAILDGAQIFGMLGNKFLGGGEAGREALLPLDQNTGWMDTIAEKVKAAMGGSSMEMSGAVDSILTRLDTIEARLMGIDDNTRIQAEKPENTYVSIGGKAVRDAVIRQGKADGFSFA